MRIVWFPQVDRGSDNAGDIALKEYLLSEHERFLYEDFQSLSTKQRRLLGRLYENTNYDCSGLARMGNGSGMLTALHDEKIISDADRDEWLLFSNGWFGTQVNARLLANLLESNSDDVIFLQVLPELRGYREKPVVTNDQLVVGFRRFYEDGIEPRPIPEQWPHHVVIRSSVLREFFANNNKSINVDSFIASIKNTDFNISSWAIAGTTFDISKQFLRSPTELLENDKHEHPDKKVIIRKNVNPWGKAQQSEAGRYKTWPWYTYAGSVKRVVDVIFSLSVLILFLPVVPVLALIIKLDSPGPIFYRARRQGRYGKEFGCLKFRSMRPGADALQDSLRSINEVDGPQFKMVDDPRISRVGHFLRETYLDEIPQFVNVLLGEMSVVGPRPSPRSENTLCPWWRDARLSVRPGVSGLWQVRRTREEGKDFQEWIQYDTEYVKKLSFGFDVWIVWKTFLSMVGKFVEKF